MEEPSSPGGLEEARSLPPGTRLGTYEIVQLLGEGGMGAVYEARHTEMGKRVAIKTLSLALTEIPGARVRFLREAQLASRVRHPHIVDVTDVGTDGRRIFLVMELLRGEDLAQRLERTGPLPPRELVDLMLPICSALVAAHEATIVHRDLKPRNLFLSAEPLGVQPKVLDFGISKSGEIASALTGSGAVIGTPFYLAPEQIQNARAAGPSSDQYAIGVILYECLAGRRPFEGESLFAIFHAIVNDRPRPLRELRADLPAGLAAIVERAMHPVPGERFPSMWALGHALLPWASPKAQAIWSDAFSAGSEGEGHRKSVARFSTSQTLPMAAAPRRAFQAIMPSAPDEVAPPTPRRWWWLWLLAGAAALLIGLALRFGSASPAGPRPVAPAAPPPTVPELAAPAPTPNARAPAVVAPPRAEPVVPRPHRPGGARHRPAHVSPNDTPVVD